MKQAIVIVMMMVLFTGSALADNCMRYNNRKICPGDSAYDALSLFGEPLYRDAVGEVTGPLGSRKVELWIYEHKLRRYELTVANGRVLVIKRVRLRRVR